MANSAKSFGVRRTILIVVSVVVGVSCNGLMNGEDAPIDRSILTDDPCAAPCWQGIRPGETTTADAWAILTQLDLMDHDFYPWRGKELDEGLERISWRTLAGGHDSIASNLFAYQGIVTQIQTSLDFEVTLQEILDKYGPPEKLQAYLASGDVASTTINFYYPEQGLILVSWAHYVSPSEPIILESTTPMTLVYYFEPTSIQRVFSKLPYFTRRLPFGTQGLQDWQGLGPIKVVR